MIQYQNNHYEKHRILVIQKSVEDRIKRKKSLKILSNNNMPV